MNLQFFSKSIILGALGATLLSSRCSNNVASDQSSLRSEREPDTEKVSVSYEVTSDGDYREENGVYTVNNGGKVIVTAKIEGSDKAKRTVEIKWTPSGTTQHANIDQTPTTWTCQEQPNTEITLVAKAVYKSGISDDEKLQIEDPGLTCKVHWMRVSDKEDAIKAIQEAFDHNQLVFSVANKNNISVENGSGNSKPPKKVAITFRALTLTNNSKKALNLQYLQEALQISLTARICIPRKKDKVYRADKVPIPSFKSAKVLDPGKNTNLDAISLDFMTNDLRVSEIQNAYHIYWAVCSMSVVDVLEKSAPAGIKWLIHPAKGGTIALKAQSTTVESAKSGVHKTK